MTEKQVTISDKEFRTDLIKCLMKHADEAEGISTTFLRNAVDAKASLHVMNTEWKSEWLTFAKEANSRLTELRQLRMANEREMRSIIDACTEVRRFFLGRDYEQEMYRLREFVELCERLQKLKDSGFLDSVADTMLKLA